MSLRLLFSVGASFAVTGIYTMAFGPDWAGHKYVAGIGLSSVAYLLAWEIMS